MKHVRTAAIEGRRLPLGVKKLRTLVLCGVRVPVVLATAEQAPELVEEGALLDGYFCFERLTIFIRAGQSRTQRRDTVVHEMAHAFLYLSGLRHRLEELHGKKKDFARFEEGLVRGVTPHLVALLRDNGGASWV